MVGGRSCGGSPIPPGAVAGSTALVGRSAIVVGSGFGGAVAALRLGQAGLRVTVLERGRRWDVDGSGTTFCTIAAPDWRCAYFGDRPPLGLYQTRRIERRTGLIAAHEGEGIRVFSGVGVGGGSLVFAAFLPQPRRRDWSRVCPAGLDYDAFEKVYWPRARRLLGASPIPADIQAHAAYRGARVWLRYIRAFGQNPVAVPFAMDWDVVRDELAGRAPACHTIGEGPFGSNSGAKNSVDRNYLRDAVGTGNVTVHALHEVSSVRQVPGARAFEVDVREIDEAGELLATKTLVADYLFLAAGSVGTSSLMVTAKVKRWLPRLPEHTGKAWGNNGDFLVARLPLRTTIGNRQGGPGNVTFFDDDNPVAPASMSWEAAPVPWVLGPGVSAHLITSIAPERGEIRYVPDTAAGRVYWPYAPMSTTAERAGRNLAARLWLRTERWRGFPFTAVPLYCRRFGSGFGARNTWHPLGGMVHGLATDLDGRVYGYEHLYCVDGSVLPGSTCLANPALTITANAERIMDRFLGVPP
jgi:cholesterol oxidase